MDDNVADTDAPKGASTDHPYTDADAQHTSRPVPQPHPLWEVEAESAL
jgi:hypothetical protein